MSDSSLIDKEALASPSTSVKAPKGDEIEDPLRDSLAPKELGDPLEQGLGDSPPPLLRQKAEPEGDESGPPIDTPEPKAPKESSHHRSKALRSSKDFHEATKGVFEDKSKVRQPLKGKGDWKSLKEQAEEVQPHYKSIVDTLIEKTGASTKELVHTKQKKGKLKSTFEKKSHPMSGTARLKGQARGDQKAKGKYRGDYGKILDIVRATLTFKDFKQLMKGMKTVMALQGELGYKVVRCKQTYTPVHATLYGDIKMNLKDMATGHICELQFTLEAFVKVKSKGHKPYEEMREANPFGDKMLDVREGDDPKKFAIAQRAIWGSYAAYEKARKEIEADKDFQAAIKLAEEIGKKLESAKD